MDPVTRPSSLADAWDLLPEVSRSFAFVTAYLARNPRTRLGDAVMVFYLVCRVLDTIEDSDLGSTEKRRMYDAFLAAIDRGDTGRLFEDPRALTRNAGYVDLLQRTDAVVASFLGLPEQARITIRRYAGEMADGMHAFGARTIVTFSDLEDYCHPVAVVVGYGLTELFHGFGHTPAPDEERFRLARSFGLALQKVNITRDYGQDHAAGRRFWPSALFERHGLDPVSVVRERRSTAALHALAEMVARIAPDADGALRYLLGVPAAEVEVRMFCAVSLWLALATLARVRANPDVFDPALPANAGSLKVSRADLAALVAFLEARVGTTPLCAQATPS
ncbi:MAG: squalene/phytoene synthase family protein [Acidobacteriota bacterium]